MNQIKIAFTYYRDLPGKLYCDARFEKYITYDAKFHKFINTVPRYIWRNCNSRIKKIKKHATFVFTMTTDMTCKEVQEEDNLNRVGPLMIDERPRRLDERGGPPDVVNFKMKLNKTCSFINGFFRQDIRFVAILKDEDDDLFEITEFIPDDLTDEQKLKLKNMNDYVDDVLIAKVNYKKKQKQLKEQKIKDESADGMSSYDLDRLLESFRDNHTFEMVKEVSETIQLGNKMSILQARFIKTGLILNQEQLSNILLLLSINFIDVDSFKLSSDGERVILNEAHGNAYGDWIVGRSETYFNGVDFKYKITRLDENEVY